MNKIKKASGFVFQHILHWVVLLILVLYTYAKFYEHPYTGFRVDTNGEVILLFIEEENSNLQIGDRLIQVDSIRWADFKSDLHQRLYGELTPGQVLSLLVDRGGKEIQVSWRIPDSNSNEFRDLLFSEGWLGYFFWIAGTFALLALRPRDQQWYLIIAFNYLTAILLVVGSGVSFYHLWGSALLLRIVIWLCVPVYLHLHWIYPSPLGRIPKPVGLVMYGFASLMAVAELFRLLPLDLYGMGFLIAVGGSFIFLLLHALLQPRSRRHLLFLLIVTVFSLLPAIAGNVIAGFIDNQNGLMAEWIRGGGALLGLPLLPFAYLYSAYRRQLGKSEVRISDFFSIYVFLLVMGAIQIPIILRSHQSPVLSGAPIVAGIILSVITILAGVWGYPFLQNLVEHRILGIPLPSKHLLERFSTHITTSSSILDLTRILQEEIFPSLLIRQFVFLHLDHEKLKMLSMINVEERQAPQEQDVPELQSRLGVYLPPGLGLQNPFEWIRLILPLKFGDRLIGLWLFGRRDPDDLYSQTEIPILRSLANQTAIALSNILQTRQIKEMYEVNVFRHEQERLRLARDLHDSVLNELAALVISGDAPVLSPKFQDAYEAVTQRLREIVSDLRPPMLNFGLKLAMESLADSLMERNHDSVQTEASIQADGEWRYPETVEMHLYRIVQEACQNALRYAHAKTIRILGTLASNKIDVTVEDDGIGFVTAINLQLDEMLVNRHFGLANMLERANLIGAEIKIDSKPGQGTKVRVRWDVK